MNTQTKITLAEYKKKLGGYVGLLYYRYCNICVKAEPAALLSTEIVSEDGVEKIEDVAMVTQGNDDFSLFLYPLDNDKIKPLIQGLLREHPEFKIKVLQCGTNEDAKFPDDLNKRLYLLLTVPPVDGNRRDVMKDATNSLYHEAEGNIESNSTSYSTRIMALAGKEDSKEVDALKKELDDIHSMHKDKIDELRDKKLHDIEEAYNRYQEKGNAATDSTDSNTNDQKKDGASSPGKSLAL